MTASGNRTRVDCFIMFDQCEPYYSLAKEDLLEKHPREVLDHTPWLEEQPHVVGEALLQKLYFAPKRLVLLEPNSHQGVLDEAPLEKRARCSLRRRSNLCDED